MLPGRVVDSRIRLPSGLLSSLSRNVLRPIGFFLATTAAACWRRGPRGCWASIVRLVGLPAHWAPLESSRRRLSSSMDFLEQFRRGPENQSEWNLMLWRITFPMLTLVLFTLLAVLGKFGHRVYSWLVCPVWYFTQFVLVAHPFLLVFKFPESDAVYQKRVWRVLALLSVAVSVMEWFLSSPPDATSRPRGAAPLPAALRAKFLRHSWIVANTVFGMIALVAIPRYFFLQRRTVARDAYDMLTASPSATSLVRPTFSPATTPVATPPQSTKGPNGPPPLADSLVPEDPSPASTTSSVATSHPVAGLASATPPTSSRGGVSTARAYASIHVVSSSSSSSSLSIFATLKHRLRGVFLLTVACALLVWITMISSYSSHKSVDVIAKYWFTVYLLAPLVCALLIVVLRGQPLSSSSNASSSYDFVAIYSLLIVHLPVFLGHLCFRLFTIIELADPAHPAHAEARGIDFANAGSSTSDGISFSASTSWMKLGISIVFLLCMQTYFYAMTQVVNAMAEPFAHPSLLYLGQLYYYLFWYVLVGSDTPMDALYWGMLLVNNVHIAFLNTGIYADVKQTSTTCFSSPLFASNLSMFKGSSMALCFRATTITMANVTATSAAAACESGSAGGGKQLVLGDKKMESQDSQSDSGADTPVDTDLFVTSSEGNDAEGANDEPGTTVKRRQHQHQPTMENENATSEAESLLADGLAGEKPIRKNGGPRRSSWTSMLRMPTPSFLAFSGVRSSRRAPATTGSSAAPAACSSSSSSATIYFTRCTCAQAREGDAHAPLCADCQSRAAPIPPVYHKSSSTVEQLRPLYFLMKLAEQDNMADTTALILVPSLLTLLAVLERPSHGFTIVAEQLNLWVRCVLMFLARMGGAHLAREIFTYKLRARLRRNNATEDTAASILNDGDGGRATRLWIQRLMLQDFHRHFWYLTVVTIVVTFACFERMEVPARFALLT